MDPVKGAPIPPPAEACVIGDRYEVGAMIGRGAMGEVRAARDRRLDREVAVKILREDIAHQPSIRERFEDEARLAARIAHPHVVAVFDTGEDAGIPYLVMERLSGRTVADEMAAGPLDCGRVRSAGIQILDALAAAHAAGVVHRDIKPGNVLVAGPRTWKVGDFGIAKSLEHSEQNLTVTGLVVGTPAYLAPERLAGGPATVSSDIYAAGVVLYEALTGRRRVQEGAHVAALQATAPMAVTDLRPDVPADLAAAVMRAMAWDPAERFATAADMADALRHTAPGPPTTDTVSVVPSLPTLQRLTSVVRQPVGLALAAAVTVALLALATVAMGASGYHRPHTSPVPPTAAQTAPEAGTATTAMTATTMTTATTTPLIAPPPPPTAEFSTPVTHGDGGGGGKGKNKPHGRP